MESWINYLMVIIYLIGVWNLIIFATKCLTILYEKVYFYITKRVAGLQKPYGKIYNWEAIKYKYVLK